MAGNEREGRAVGGEGRERRRKERKHLQTEENSRSIFLTFTKIYVEFLRIDENVLGNTKVGS